MPYADAGSVFWEIDRSQPGVETWLFNWKADAAGVASKRMEVVMSGVLERGGSNVTDAGTAGTHAAYLYDELGVDMFRGLCASLAGSAYAALSFYEAPEADIALPVLLTGRHTFRVTGADASDFGTLKLVLRT